jgi:hypothetical protein
MHHARLCEDSTYAVQAILFAEKCHINVINVIKMPSIFLAWYYCFHQLTSQHFSGERLGSNLAETEDWTEK